MQNPGDQRTRSKPPLILNEPFGSDIVNGVLYVADRDGGTGPNDPTISVIRRFEMANGAPSGEIRVEASTGFNDIAVAGDGTIYATQTGAFGQTPDPTSWQIWKIPPKGAASIFFQGAPLRQPNGIALDQQGNIVVVNIGNADVLTFSTEGKLLRTESRGSARKRRPGHHEGRHEVREQRRQRRRLANPSESAGDPYRAEHSKRGVDVL